MDILTVKFRERLLKNAKTCDIMRNGSSDYARFSKIIESIERAKAALLARSNYNAVITELFIGMAV